MKPLESISALRALVGKSKRALQCFGFSQIVQTLCDLRAPEILSGGFPQSLIILVDIECIDYS